MAFTVTYHTSVLPTDQWLNATLVAVDGTDGLLVYNGNLCLRFVFELSDDEHDKRRVSVLTGHRFTPNTMLGRILKGMLGREPDAGDDFAPESFIGQKFQVKMEPKPSNGRTFYNVVDVRPAEDKVTIPF